MKKKQLRNLTDAAIADGAKSGLTKNDMLKLGMHSLAPEAMQSKFGVDGEGLVIPYDGQFCRAKILNGKSKFGTKDARKYTQIKGTKPKLYLPKLTGTNWERMAKDPTQILLLTEGEKKAAAACKAGLQCIGVPGCMVFSL